MTNSNGNSRTLTAVRPDIFQIFLQDEDGQNILSIDDGALRQSLRIEIVNTSGRNIEFQPVDNQLSLDNYHVCISFRPGTLLLTEDEDKRITLKETGEGWQMQQQDNVFYLLLTSFERKVIENGERITLTLENIGAAPEGGSRGTRVEIKYNQLQYQGSNETISGNRLQYLNIVNQRGKKQIPLYVGFLGSNRILNDGTENELTLTIQSLPNQSASLTFLDSPEITAKDTTRWEKDVVKFLQEKISNFSAVIKELAQNTSLRDRTRSFFGKLDSLINSNLPETSDSFERLKQEVNGLNLQDIDKSEIVTIIINNLGIVSRDDLNSIATKLGELFSFALTQIQEIIQQSTTLQLIKSEFNQDGSLEFKGLDSQSTLDNAGKFTISFDVATIDNDSKHWALVEKTDADDIHIIIEHGQDHWVFGGKEEQGITPRWSFLCKQGFSLEKRDRKEILRLKISNLKTQLLSGYANLYVHYENIPGYWDGYITVPIHKGPLVYREYETSDNVKVGCVGIGTDEPQAKLHVKSSNGIDGLKVEGNTAITNNLKVENETRTQILRVDAWSRSSHVNRDGVIYRKDKQVYITVDDNLYIRDSKDGGDNFKMHFNTNNGKLTVSSLSIGNTVIYERDLQILKALKKLHRLS